MKRSPLIIAAVAVLLIGVVAIALNLFKLDETTQVSGNPGGAPPRSGETTSDGTFRPDGNPKSSPRTAREVTDRELVEKYGESRTTLARSVSENVVGLLDDVISMGEMMTEGRAGNFGGGGLGWVTRGSGVELNAEQQEKAEALLKDFRQRELERTKAAVADLRDDPTALMGMLLAGDARSREELTEEQYAALQQANADKLGDVINPLDRNNFRGGSPMDDEQFRSGFEALLDQDQSAAYAEAQAKKEEDKPETGSGRTNITQLPVMDLEKADEAIRSTRQMTAGFKQVVEGMGNLGPLLEQQRQNRGGESNDSE